MPPSDHPRTSSSILTDPASAAVDDDPVPDGGSPTMPSIPLPAEVMPLKADPVAGAVRGPLDLHNHHPHAPAQHHGPPLGLSTLAEQRSQSASPFRLSLPSISPAQLAFSCMQYMPVPVLVLNNLKTVVLANDAMGRMLGISNGNNQRPGSGDLPDVLERLRGQTLSQVGIDMLQDGRPVWVTWDTFLDSLVYEMNKKPARESSEASTGDETPMAGDAPGAASQNPLDRYMRDAVVEVIVSRKDVGSFFSAKKTSEHQLQAKLIISIFEVEGHQPYFILTFTSTHSVPSTLAKPRKSVARPSQLEAAERRSIPHTMSNPPSLGSGHEISPSTFRISPSAVSLSSSPFPPMGPPSNTSHTSSPSILQKMMTVREALTESSQMPILAMWKDGSVTFPNKAARKLFFNNADFDRSVDGFDILPFWKIYNEDFTRQLDLAEYPITTLLRTEKPFQGVRIGMYDEHGKKLVFDCLGEAIRDETTGEFLAGVVTGRDVTKLKNEITEIREQDEERFKLICDTMPQLVWTTTDDGHHDFFNTRWYSYTGLTPEESLGLGWKTPFHPDDLVKAFPRWQRSMETGEPYVTEYRCRSKEGEWRWFLGRALPLRNKQTGKIEKWFGTCTDVNEGVEAKMAATRTRQQLINVLSHSRVTIFSVDGNRKITMLEGALIWDAEVGGVEAGDGPQRWYVGENMYDVFNRIAPRPVSTEQPGFLEPVEEMLSGKFNEEMQEHEIDGRWYRIRYLPIVAKRTKAGRFVNEVQAVSTLDSVPSGLEGVIGMMADVTEVKQRESELEEEAREKRKALADAEAAEAASLLKSSFLANTSHELRTPISGVLGSAELLADTEGLNKEQREYVENIQRSANALLTVINDILDLSKVESGRLDIEEVQFSLPVIVDDIRKMLSVSAEKKGLDFQLDISDELRARPTLLGDANRVKQVCTNVLSNSIKFTKEGHVRFSIIKQKETVDTVDVRFIIEDTGLGIPNEVRKKLFQPFSQGDSSTARRFGGTGLGLAICKNLVDLMGGKILLESRVGAGTTVTFWIPFKKSAGPDSHAGLAIHGLPGRLQSDMSVSCDSSEYEHGVSPSPTGETSQSPQPNTEQRSRSTNASPVRDDIPPSQRAKMHVLVVEDNEINQHIAIRTLKKLNFSVSAVWNGKEALQYLKDAQEGKQPKPQIILLDIMMPFISGYRCAHLLRHHSPYKAYVKDVPIVAMTASAIQGDREKCMRAGMDDYLAKPVKGKILEKMLVKWLSAAGQKLPSHADALEAGGDSDCGEAEDQCTNPETPENEDGPVPVMDTLEVPEEANLASPLEGEPTPIAAPKTIFPASLDEKGPGPHVEEIPSSERPTDDQMRQMQMGKLLESAGRTSSAAERQVTLSGPEQALTEENMGRLAQEHALRQVQSQQRV